MASHGDYAAIAHARGKERWTRLAAAVILGAVAYALAPSPWPWLWLLAVAAAQVPDAIAFRPLVDADRAPSRGRLMACAAAAGLSTAIYSAIAAYLWTQGGAAGQVVAAMVLAAALMHVSLHLHASRTILGVTLAPFLILWFALPVISRGVFSPIGVVAIEAAAALYVAHLGVALRHSRIGTEALRQARDEAHAANHAKSTFLATISHEIRTPLNGILGMAQAMSAEALPQVQASRLDVIRQSGRSLLAILNDVLDLSKIEAGKLELEVMEFDLSELMAEAWRAYAVAAEAKGLTLSLTVAPEADGRYRGDPTRLRQILNNFLSNALKFTDEGGVRIEVTRRDGLVTLGVADTGPGLSAEQLDSLFQRFSQADLSRPRTHGGTGLGLAICRELARLMDGDVIAVSAVGQGSTFSLTLSLERTGEALAPAVAGPAEPPSPPQDASVIRLLAAEDNPVNQLVLKTLLQQAGIDPVVVGDGREAVDAWRAGAWDLILLDMQMPRMDGPTAARLIRAEEAATGRPRTPIIALTANVMTHQRDEYRLIGMDDCVAKPIEVQRLYAAISNVLNAAPGDTADASAAAAS